MIEILLQLVFLIFCGSAFISLIYIYGFYLRLALFKNHPNEDLEANKPISIIICAQNELKNLLVLIPALLEQDYPTFELIIVDDSSTDDTTFLLQDLVKQDSRLHIIELSESVKNKQGKKFALMMGIKGAKYDHVLLSDADCMPTSNQWIKKMQAGFSEEKEIVLGYSPYSKKGGLLNLFIRYETFMTASNYFSFALAKIPYMGVGRNLAYHKHLFFDNKGFASHIHLMSGDDDLFINQVATAKNVSIVIDPKAYMISKPKLSYGDYIHQKLRHLSVGKYYKPWHQFVLSVNPISNILFFISFVVLVSFKTYFPIPLFIFGFHLISFWIIFLINSKKLKDPILGIISPILQVLYHFFLIWIKFIGLFTKAKTWK